MSRLASAAALLLTAVAATAAGDDSRLPCGSPTSAAGAGSVAALLRCSYDVIHLYHLQASTRGGTRSRGCGVPAAAAGAALAGSPTSATRAMQVRMGHFTVATPVLGR